MSSPPYVTTTTLAAALGLSHDTVKRAADRGELGAPTQTPGGPLRAGAWRWTLEEAARVVTERGGVPPAAWGEALVSSGAAA